ncbi:hypothetical protein ACFVT6_02420 [Streptomyces sp. NPDC058049]
MSNVTRVVRSRVPGAGLCPHTFPFQVDAPPAPAKVSAGAAVVAGRWWG